MENQFHLMILGNKVILEYYKLEETFTGSISLDKDVAGQYETPTMKKGAAQQGKKSPLEEVVEKFNDHYAGEITEGDKILIGILMEKMSTDEVLRKSAQQDGEQIFVNSVFSKAYDRNYHGFVQRKPRGLCSSLQRSQELCCAEKCSCRDYVSYVQSIKAYL